MESVTAEVIVADNPNKREPCPVCHARRALAFSKSNGSKPLVHCHAGCSQEDVIEALKAEGRWSSGGQSPARTRVQPVRIDDPENEESKRFERAAAILYEASRSGKLAKDYLNARGIEKVPKNAYLLPAGRFAHPSLVLPIHGSGEQLGAHVIALNRKSNGKAKIDTPKRAYGLVKGGYTQLGRPDPGKPLIVAEGVETALSAAELVGDLPAIATLGTSGMKNLQGVPPNSEVIIARDLGTPGLEAAKTLAQRLVRKGKKVRIAPPPKRRNANGEWWDWNDALQSDYDRKKLRRMLTRGRKVPAPKGPLDWKYQFVPDEQRLAEIADAKMVIPGLIPFSQATAVIGKANAGKTTVCMDLAAKAAASGYKVTYVNADISADDAKKAFRLATEGGFDLLLPDFVPEGRSMNDIVVKLTETAQLDVSLSDEVWFFDNLKKMTDLISKAKAKILFELFRRLTAKGMTIIAEGHTNKYDQADGSPIFEGVGDLRNDVDNLIYMIARKSDDGTTTVSFKPDKVRAPLEHMTATITPDRRVEWSDEYIDLTELARSEQQREKDDSVIEVITEYLSGGEANQSDVVKYCQKQKIGRDTVHRVLKRYVGDQWNVRNELINNAKIYKLVPKAKGGGSERP